MHHMSLDDLLTTMADDSDDEHSGDAVSDQTELSLILDKLSLEPKKEKKKLLVLSLSGLLLHRVHKKYARNSLKRYPDASCGPNLLYKRPFAEKFTKFVLRDSKLVFGPLLAILTYRKNVDIILNIVLENLKDKLLFVWGNTGLFPLSYNPSNSKDNFLDPEGEFCSYLDGLAKSADVQAKIILLDSP